MIFLRCGFLFLCSLLITSDTAMAQMRKLSGKVTNTQLEPLSYATVQIKGLQIGTKT
ncbi:MAG: hypothetical protein RIQ62_1887, partial [Bacteroidota bacterium]